ncbi:uncharacterized protein BX664DRAFT_119204 [Halteromyces radiatus]|uniref:uncharacterized protein n=1 Tax=Halteromyces radiatus TaxID=101107 RepID=UPI0022208CC2|nr:uncharacterized protein BX664DRAFT_119204 [Halteromyces radiatus]KAI8088704.1 hypothetical protein BX664DRAFT_119204 [Halteromyces radiatus]
MGKKNVLLFDTRFLLVVVLLAVAVPIVLVLPNNKRTIQKKKKKSWIQSRFYIIFSPAYTNSFCSSFYSSRCLFSFRNTPLTPILVLFFFFYRYFIK